MDTAHRNKKSIQINTIIRICMLYFIYFLFLNMFSLSNFENLEVY